MKYAAIFFGHLVSLDRTSPPLGDPVCEGEPLVYKCIASFGIVWEESGITNEFVTTSALHEPKTARRFQFELTDVINNSVLISTATIRETSLNDSGINLKCIEIPNVLITSVTVVGKLRKIYIILLFTSLICN